MIEMIGGPDRDRTGDLFHAILTAACNSLITLERITTHRH